MTTIDLLARHRREVAAVPRPERVRVRLLMEVVLETLADAHHLVLDEFTGEGTPCTRETLGDSLAESESLGDLLDRLGVDAYDLNAVASPDDVRVHRLELEVLPTAEV